MKLYEYWLGLYPLDWEFCFMPVQTYKNFITEQYHKNPTFYNISAGSIEKVLAHIDVILSAAMEDWNNTTNHAALRCPPMIFPLPKGQDSNTAEFAIILKMDNDGDRGIFNLTCPYRLNAAAHRRQRKHADPVKQAPQPERRHLICAPVP